MTVQDLVEGVLENLELYEHRKATAGAIIAAIRAAGLAIVLREPTDAVCEAYHHCDWGCSSDPSTPAASEAWDAMVAAAEVE